MSAFDWMNFRVYILPPPFLCVCLLVCFPATSIQQGGIRAPDVCDLLSGRSCSGEASNVLNIIRYRWSLTHIRTLTLPFQRYFHICVQAGHSMRLQIPSHPALALPLLLKQYFPVWMAKQLGAIWLWNKTWQARTCCRYISVLLGFHCWVTTNCYILDHLYCYILYQFGMYLFHRFDPETPFHKDNYMHNYPLHLCLSCCVVSPLFTCL